MTQDYEQQRALQKGQRIDHYVIEGVLGAGGFGITYLAQDTNMSNFWVAIKEYFPMFAYRDEGTHHVRATNSDAMHDYQLGLNRFLEEANTLARFKHANIVRAFRVFQANKTAYMVMDYEEGKTLEDHLNDVGQPLSDDMLYAIFMPILDGLREVHQYNLLHLDIKPSNIFLRKDSSPCLIDFGGARHFTGQNSRIVQRNLEKGKKVSSMVATDGYAPPEQYSEKNIQGYCTDIYAVGATMYYCLTFKIPEFASDRNMSVINDDQDSLRSLADLSVSSRFNALIEQCLSLAKKPALLTLARSVL